MSSASLLAAVTPRPIESADLLRSPRRRRSPLPTAGTLARSLGVLTISACAVVALARFQYPRHVDVPAAPAAVKVEAATASPAKATAPDVRLVYGNPDAVRATPRQAEPSPPEPVIAAEAPTPVAVPTPAPVARLEAAPAAIPDVAPVTVSPVAAGVPRATVADTAADASPASVSTGIDLNAAPVELLNDLGAGMIGRAIVRGRPYASPQDLVDRRILSRASFDRIKDRVGVGAPR